jgi:hypothetical protein
MKRCPEGKKWSSRELNRLRGHYHEVVREYSDEQYYEGLRKELAKRNLRK